MPNLDAKLNDLVAGDDYDVERDIIGVPSGQVLVKGWLTVKLNKTDADPGVVQKIITSAVDPAGYISDDGGGDGTGHVIFQLQNTDTVLLTSHLYYYDIQVKTNAGKIYTAEIGTIIPNKQVTTTTS